MQTMEPPDNLVPDTCTANQCLGPFITLAVLALVGLLVLLCSWLVLELAQVVQLFVQPRVPWFQASTLKYGHWALISNVTDDGVGLSLARELARRGHSLVLAGSDKTELSRIKACLQSTQPSMRGQVMLASCDLTKNEGPESLDCDSLELSISPQARRIGILINCLRAPLDQSSTCHHWHQTNVEVLRRSLEANVMLPVLLTRMLAPGMLARNSGLVMNVVATDATPQQGALFAATQAYAQSMTSALCRELAPSSLAVTCLCIKLAQKSKPRGSWMSQWLSLASSPCCLTPGRFAKIALDVAALGLRMNWWPCYYQLVQNHREPDLSSSDDQAIQVEMPGPSSGGSQVLHMNPLLASNTS